MTALRPSASDLPREPSLTELTQLARYATDRVALYRRRIYIGRGVPKRLAELERIAAGATERLRAARARAPKSP